jgi:hypothetical protein
MITDAMRRVAVTSIEPAGSGDAGPVVMSGTERLWIRDAAVLARIRICLFCFLSVWRVAHLHPCPGGRRTAGTNAAIRARKKRNDYGQSYMAVCVRLRGHVLAHADLMPHYRRACATAPSLLGRLPERAESHMFATPLRLHGISRHARSRWSNATILQRPG